MGGKVYNSLLSNGIIKKVGGSKWDYDGFLWDTLNWDGSNEDGLVWDGLKFGGSTFSENLPKKIHKKHK